MKTSDVVAIVAWCFGGGIMAISCLCVLYIIVRRQYHKIQKLVYRLRQYRRRKEVASQTLLLQLNTGYQYEHTYSSLAHRLVLYNFTLRKGSSIPVNREYTGKHHPNLYSPTYELPEGETPNVNVDQNKNIWYLHHTWHTLVKNEHALKNYALTRAITLNNLNYDWSEVFTALMPKIKEGDDYAGLINLNSELKLLTVTKMTKNGKECSKLANRPALFIFHTHFDDVEGYNGPTPLDIASAIFESASGRYAANLTITRQGIYLVGLDAAQYRTIWTEEYPYGHIATLAQDFLKIYKNKIITGELSSKEILEEWGILYIHYPVEMV